MMFFYKDIETKKEMYQHIKYFGKGGSKTFHAKDDSYR